MRPFFSSMPIADFQGKSFQPTEGSTVFPAYSSSVRFSSSRVRFLVRVRTLPEGHGFSRAEKTPLYPALAAGVRFFPSSGFSCAREQKMLSRAKALINFVLLRQGSSRALPRGLLSHGLF